jgi:hypothetical protein
MFVGLFSKKKKLVTNIKIINEDRRNLHTQIIFGEYSKIGNIIISFFLRKRTQKFILFKYAVSRQTVHMGKSMTLSTWHLKMSFDF